MFDVVVLGGGPAGMSAALRANELGASVALIERGRLGGMAFTDGVIVTRVLARAAEMQRETARFADFGLKPQPSTTLDFAALRKRVLEVSETMRSRKGQRLLVVPERLTLYTDAGEARFADAHSIQLGDGRQVQGKSILICVGGSPRKAAFPGHELTTTHRGVLDWERMPDSVAIVGAGATGCHLTSVLTAFGVRVTLLETAHHILPTEDVTVSEVMAEEFRKTGVQIITGFKAVERVEGDGSRCKLVYSYGDKVTNLSVGAVVLAIGWPGNAVGLGLDAIGVRTIGGNFVETNDYLQTAVGHIYAAGDITGRMLLVHNASYQGLIAAENALLDIKREAQYRGLPRGTFTEPEYAAVGMTEQQAREAYNTVAVTVPFSDLDRAVIDGRTAGFCKLIADRDSGRLLGAHVVGYQAKELISLVTASLSTDLAIAPLIELELAYPSYNAIVGLAARRLSNELKGEAKTPPEWPLLFQWFGSDAF